MKLVPVARDARRQPILASDNHYHRLSACVLGRHVSGHGAGDVESQCIEFRVAPRVVRRSGARLKTVALVCKGINIPR
jgi:hypothetical protein